ncbi:MAG: DNA polymerase III subunit gamma/tau [Clostridia bacterium]|nr:DNA polymerase III subunit gamma/tau [Clostridia bacterium]
MAYIALYRQWRPQTFNNLVGQDNIRKTLQNSIVKERIAHAYLFSGPRGTGKTSMAKILAKAVNCLNVQEGEPCNNCLVCNAINEGCSMDVLEIDAASNRGIEEIRDLKEKINFVPSQGKYKVYIIDEVHMLTTEAFNALLKTLEEPPAHVIFVLATTEPQKIPATILSRCQRFDFKKITVRDMEGRLTDILNAYEVTADEGALSLIVRKAEGGMRDAIGILDQCISYGDKHISLKIAYEVMGLVKNDVLIAIVQGVIDKDTAEVLFHVNELLKEGTEAGQIIKDLLEYLRNLLLLQVCGSDTELVLIDGEEKEKMIKQGKQLGMDWISKAIVFLAKTEGESRWSKNLRIVLETSLIKLIYQENNLLNEHVVKYSVDKEVVNERNESEVGKRQQKQQEEQKKQKEQTQQIKAKKVKKADAVKDSNLVNIEKEGKESSDISIEDIKKRWVQVMDDLKESKRSLHAFLTVSTPYEIKNNKLVLLFKKGYTFHKEKVEEGDNKKLIQISLEKVVGIKLDITCTLEDDNGVEEDPIQKARDIFGSDVVVMKD